MTTTFHDNPDASLAIALDDLERAKARLQAALCCAGVEETLDHVDDTISDVTGIIEKRNEANEESRLDRNAYEIAVMLAVRGEQQAIA